MGAADTMVKSCSVERLKRSIAFFSRWPEPAAFFGGNRNPPESGEIRSKYRNSCPTGIPAKKSCKSEKKTGIPVTPSKSGSCEKIHQKTQGKKISSGILSGTVFWVQKLNSRKQELPT
jgi:hypothetical protein